MLPQPYRFKSLRLVLTALLTFSLSAVWLGHGAGLPLASAQVTPTFKNFEGPQVHPLAMTPDGTRLLAVNTPNATLSVLQLTGGTPLLTAEIPVGLEPVSVAVRNNREAWVVNWLSDSVSVVDLSTGNVTRTLDVGDEPTDVLFAGINRELAFVCVSGRSQVKVFDPSNASSLPQQSIDIFGKQPRALARDASGGRVFVSVFESGNLTTVVPEAIVAANGGLPPPNPALAAGLPQPPVTSLIVKWNGSAWLDETGKSWSQFLPFRLADEDVMLINSAGFSPALAGVVRGIGTHNGNMAFDSATNQLFVANLDSTSAVRFEPNLKGRFQSNRITVVNALPSSTPTIAGAFDLNPHVDLAGSGSDAERAESLALPADLARAADGTLFVAATSSARVGVFDSAGAVQARIAVGEGPTGLALDEARSLLYVLNRFEHTLSVVNTSSRSEVSRLSIGTNPEPQGVRDGRKFLYDANLSAHGTVSCASCHPGGHRDGLAWDLGDPRGTMDQAQGTSFHPMKGPMVSQSLRDIVGNAPLHWRGDRSNLAAFNAAFVSLLGGPRQLTADEMASFEAFVRSLAYPPNPNEPVDRSMSGAALSGLGFFSREKLDGGLINCSDCHITTNFSPGTNNLIIPAAALKESQAFKVPQLRGLYQKTGLNKTPNPNDARGQITGFGFAHDGTFDTLFN
nr:hypothetical protein [Acidobacteriota bacterium]